MGILIYFYILKNMAQKMAEQLGKAGRYLVALGVAMPIFNSALYNVDAGERVLIFDRVRGVREKLYNPGTHFRIPILQDPIKFDVRTTHHSVRSVTGRKGKKKKKKLKKKGR